MRKYCWLAMSLFVTAQFALAQPQITYSASSLEFGTLPVGQHADRTVAVNNTGDEGLHVQVSVTGDGFTLSSALRFIIEAGDTTTWIVVVRCEPFTADPHYGQLHLRTNCLVDSHVVVPLYANGAGAEETFDLASPPDSSVASGTSLQLVWTALRVTPVPTYMVRIATPAGPWLEFDAGADTSLIVTTGALAGAGWYEWWVDASSMGLIGSQSHRYFYLGGGPSAELHLLFPADSAQIFSADCTFSWHTVTPPVSGVDYELWITAADSTGGIFTRTYWTVGDTTETVSFDDFATNTSYVWWVVGYTGYDSVFVSERRQFTLLASTAAERLLPPQPDAPAIVAAYPNPFNPATTIQYSVPAATALTLRMYNSLGQEVATLQHGSVAAGTHSLTFDARTLPAGLYFCRLETARGSATHRLLLLK